MDSSREQELTDRLVAGHHDALAELFTLHRTRLRRLVEIRLDPRLKGRIDASDVIQETYLDVLSRLHEFVGGQFPFFLWLRLKVGNRLTDLHRYHLRSQKRSATREVSLQTAMPTASSVVLADWLIGRQTSAGSALELAEMRHRVEVALNDMHEMDREILVLRHFEDLSNAEAAQVLSISQNAASNRYVRALRRLRQAMLPGEL